MISEQIHVGRNWPLPKVHLNRKRKVRAAIHYKLQMLKHRSFFLPHPLVRRRSKSSHVPVVVTLAREIFQKSDYGAFLFDGCMA